MKPPRLLGTALAMASLTVLPLSSCRGGAGAPTPTKASLTSEPPADPEPIPADPKPETRQTPMVQTHLLLTSDDDFFSAAASPSTGTVRDLVRGGFRGIAIDAPFSMDSAAHDRLPVVGVFVREGGKDDTFFRNAMLVLVDAEGGGMLVTPAFEPLDGDEVDDASPPGPSGGVAVQRFALDVRGVVDGLPWGPASWRIFVAYEGSISNGTTVTLDGEGTLSKLLPPPKIEGVPPLSEPPATETGVSLSTPAPSAATEPGRTVLLEGRVVGRGTSQPVALLGLGPAPTPFVAGLEAAIKNGVGSFAVNVLGDNPLPKAPGTWHFYAFSGAHHAGPVTIELTPGETPW